MANKKTNILIIFTPRRNYSKTFAQNQNSAPMAATNIRTHARTHAREVIFREVSFR